jgi:aminoglycoside phosphotransferase (APT) family kinase protein
MKILASGRDGDIFEFAPGLVLRKTRDGRSIAHEARTMRYVADHGYPVPHIEEVRADGTEIIMERIDGPIMVDAMVRPPWKLGDHLRLLADLHDQLHRIPAPDWLPAMPDTDVDAETKRDGNKLLHLDLHPLNVIMSPHGPVVVDWPNARGGDPMVDVAISYALIACGDVPLPRPVAVAVDAVRRPALNHWFAKRYAGAHFSRRVAEMAELKCFDTNMSGREIRSLRRLAAKFARARDRGKAPG